MSQYELKNKLKITDLDLMETVTEEELKNTTGKGYGLSFDKYMLNPQPLPPKVYSGIFMSSIVIGS